MTSDKSEFHDNDIVYYDKAKPLLSLVKSGNRLEIVNGKLYINNNVQPVTIARPIVKSIAYLMDRQILVGINSKRNLSNFSSSRRGYTIQLTWEDLRTNELIHQFFNDTSVRKGVNNKDFGSSKNGLLYRTFSRITGIEPKPSRIPITKMLNLFILGQTKTFGKNNDLKLENSSISTITITCNQIFESIPEEFHNCDLENTLSLYTYRTQKTPEHHSSNTKSSHVKTPQPQVLSTLQDDLNACNNNAVNILTLNMEHSAVNSPRYIYDTEAEIENL